MSQRTAPCTHIPADKELVIIKPGKYFLSHVDFETSVHSRIKTQHFSRSVEFEFEAGVIYFVGNLKLRRKSPNRYEMEIDQDTSLVARACASSPDIFEKYPVSNLTGTKKFKLSCSE